jgi:hypothetical protein
MQEEDIKKILHKVEELKAVFTFGVKFVPFLEDLLVFVQEMAPMLNEMNKSIQDSSSKMPKAVQQLDKVTSATEMATHEILDKVDDMLAKLDGIEAHFKVVGERLKSEQKTLSEIAGGIEDLLKIPGVRETLGKLFEDETARQLGVKIKGIVDEFLAGKVEDSLPEAVEQLLHDTQTDAYDIMNSLQVQDITAQQIEAAHVMLYSIQERLNHLIMKYSEAEPPQIFRQARAHDAEASYVGSDDRQKMADEVLEQEEDRELHAEDPAPEAAAGAETEEPLAGFDEALETAMPAESGLLEEAGPGDLPESKAFEESLPEEQGEQGENPIDELLSWGDEKGEAAPEPDAEIQAFDEQPLPGEIEPEAMEPIEEIDLPEPEALEGEKPEEMEPDRPDEAGGSAGKTRTGKSRKVPKAEDGISISQDEIDKLFQ